MSNAIATTESVKVRSDLVQAIREIARIERRPLSTQLAIALEQYLESQPANRLQRSPVALEATDKEASA